jgi:hypothetical protein
VSGGCYACGRIVCERCRWWAGAALVAGAALAISALSGCGASAVRVHADTARMTMVAVDAAGVAIEEATRAGLDRCAGLMEQSARLGCIDGVERDAVLAAAARDALVAPVHAYRDATLLVQDEEQAKPGLVAYLGVLALAIARDWPAFADAMRALGLPVPEVDLPEVP